MCSFLVVCSKLDGRTKHIHGVGFGDRVKVHTAVARLGLHVDAVKIVSVSRPYAESFTNIVRYDLALEYRATKRSVEVPREVLASGRTEASDLADRFRGYCVGEGAFKSRRVCDPRCGCGGFLPAGMRGDARFLPGHRQRAYERAKAGRSRKNAFTAPDIFLGVKSLGASPPAPRSESPILGSARGLPGHAGHLVPPWGRSWPGHAVGLGMAA